MTINGMWHYSMVPNPIFYLLKRRAVVFYNHNNKEIDWPITSYVV